MSESTDIRRSTDDTTRLRVWGLEQIARRAGVSRAEFDRWRIEQGGEHITVFPFPGSAAGLRFPVFGGPLSASLASGPAPRLRWPGRTSARAQVGTPDFIVPFTAPSLAMGQDVFRVTDAGIAEWAWDVPFSAALTLSRWEETLDGERDAHGRFAAATSVAGRNGFLERPIVDEYGLALAEAMKRLQPSWEPRSRSPALKLSHDVDLVGIPWNFRQAMGHLVRRGRIGDAIRDVTAPLTRMQPTYLRLVHHIVALAARHGVKSRMYWKDAAATAFDSGYRVGDLRVSRTIRALREQGVECGVHPGYATFRSPEALQAEVRRLREVLGNGPLGGRQHYLRWEPETWKHWEGAGLSYDSSVGFADHIGFRAGTCVPYRPWLLTERREANLTEIPLLVMDGTLYGYMSLRPAEALERVRRLKRECEKVGGVFAILWHNDTLIDPKAGALDEVLACLADLPTFDVNNAGTWE